MEQIVLEIIGKLLAAAAIALLSYISVNIVPKLKNWLIEKIGNANTEKLMVVIDNFVRSAEQLFHTEDPDGTIRKQYVIDQLTKLGYIVNDEVNAIIESKVWDLNIEKKAVEPKE